MNLVRIRDVALGGSTRLARLRLRSRDAKTADALTVLRPDHEMSPSQTRAEREGEDVQPPDRRNGHVALSYTPPTGPSIGATHADTYPTRALPARLHTRWRLLDRANAFALAYRPSASGE